MMSKIQPQRNTFSIVGKLLEEDIIEKSLQSYFPQKAIYQSCWQNTKKIQNSIMAVAQHLPDCSPSKIPLIEDSIRNPTTFKVKHRSMPEQGFIYKSTNKDEARISVFSIQNLKSTPTQSQNCRQLKPSSHSDFQTRFYPNTSLHSPSNSKIQDGIYLHLKNKQYDKKNQVHDEFIKTLREIKIHEKNYLHKNSLNSKNKNKETLKRQKNNNFMRNLKQTKLKKGFTTTMTNYEGKNVQILKKQIPKIVPHFIDVGVQIIEENIKSEAFKPYQQIIKNMPDVRRQSLQTNLLKQIEINEQNSLFAKNFLKKFSVQQGEEHLKIIDTLQNEEKNLPSNNQQVNKQKQFQQFRFIGNNYEPSKVGFKIFQRLKKANWKTQKAHQNLNKHKNKCEWKRQEYIKKIKQSKSPSQNEVIPKQNIVSSNKKEKINIGNQFALDYLLNDKKSIKKKVTIISEFCD